MRHRFHAAMATPTHSPHGQHARPFAAPARIAAIAALVLLAIACGGSGTGFSTPQTEMSTAQAMLDLNSEILTLREENAMLQAQLDSLRDVVARQDTTLRQVANLLGVSLPPR